MYQARVWLRYGRERHRDERQVGEPVGQRPPAAVAEFAVSRSVSRPAANRSARIIGAAGGRPRVALVDHQVQREGHAEGGVVVGRARRAHQPRGRRGTPPPGRAPA